LPVQIGPNDPPQRLLFARRHFGDCKEQPAIRIIAFGAHKTRANRQFQHEARELIAVDNVRGLVQHPKTANGKLGPLQHKIVGPRHKRQHNL